MALHTGGYRVSNLVPVFSQNHINPAMDFTQTPPGMLALDNMLYLAKVHQDTYIRVMAQGQWAPPCCHRSRLPNPCRRPHRSSWRTAAGKTSTSAPSAAAPSSSPKCSVRSCRSGSCVSPRHPPPPSACNPEPGELEVTKLGVSGTGRLLCLVSRLILVYGTLGCCLVRAGHLTCSGAAPLPVRPRESGETSRREGRARPAEES